MIRIKNLVLSCSLLFISATAFAIVPPPPGVSSGVGLATSTVSVEDACETAADLAYDNALDNADASCASGFVAEAFSTTFNELYVDEGPPATCLMQAIVNYRCVPG